MGRLFARLDRHAARGFLVLSLLFAGAPVLGDPPLKTTQVRIGKHVLKVEIVASEPERAKGLMFREKLGKNDGMLFIFDAPGYHSMWMMNTLIPLSVAFIDAGGVILNIRDMEPKTTDTHMAEGPARYAIETNKGWFAERGVKAGDKVAGLPRP